MANSPNVNIRILESRIKNAKFWPNFELRGPTYKGEYDFLPFMVETIISWI